MNLTAVELDGFPADLTSVRTQVEAIIPFITAFHDWQWQLAVKLRQRVSMFLMLPCNSGKTLVWLGTAVQTMLHLNETNGSQCVTVVSAPMNQIIKGQIPLVNAIPGMQAISYLDNPIEAAKAMTSTEHQELYTVVFYNPHESNTDAFASLIANSVPYRIRCMAFDEGGIVTKWGGGTFRPVLRQQRRYLVAWFKVHRKFMPFVVFTGAANIGTCALLKQYFLPANKEWDVCIKRSPFENLQVVVKVKVLQNRDEETRVVSEVIKQAHGAHVEEPDAKYLVMTEYVGDLQKQQESLLKGLNDQIRGEIEQNVVAVYAHASCVNRETDIGRFESGRDGVRTMIATYGLLIAGWSCRRIVCGVGRGQPDTTEDNIQALSRIARGLMATGTFVFVVSYTRRLEQRWRQSFEMMKNGATPAEINNAVRQMKMIDINAQILLYPDHQCIVVLLDKDIMGSDSKLKTCQQLHRHDPSRWCSSCEQKAHHKGVITELIQFTTKFYTNKSAALPTGINWSELENASGTAIKPVAAGCLKGFLQEQQRPPGSNRSKHLEEIRKMLNPVRLKRHVVNNALKRVLPDADAWTTMETIQKYLGRAMPRANPSMVVECVQRLVLARVLKDTPPHGIETKRAAVANAGAWLVARGELFNTPRRWPPLQPPERPRSYVSRRIENKRKRGGTCSGGSGGSKNKN